MAMTPRQLAEAQRIRIEKFWHDRGATTVKAWIESTLIDADGHHREFYAVRSNLLNGQPPK
jgi:hypothetical protein